MDPKNEVDSFIDGLPGSEQEFDIQGDLNGTPAEGIVTPPAKTDDEDNLPFNKNPKMKRFIEKEVSKRLKEFVPPTVETIEVPATTSEVPSQWLAMYGDTEDTRKAWKLQSEILNDYKTQAKQEALDEIRSEQEREQSAVAQYQESIENSLEEIEEREGVDLSGTKEARDERTKFLDLVQRLSPKDAQGNVTQYADFDEVWDIYKSRKQTVNPVVSKQKELAARGMTKSNEAPTTNKGYEAGMGSEGVRRALGLD